MRRRRLRYKGVSVGLLGLPVLNASKSKIKSKPNPKRHYLKSFSMGIKGKVTRNLLIIYDIPEVRKKERDWFRRQLVNFEFILIQKSVWVGPSPLPKDFLDYAGEIGLRDNFKTFKLAKSYAE